MPVADRGYNTLFICCLCQLNINRSCSANDGIMHGHFKKILDSSGSHTEQKPSADFGDSVPAQTRPTNVQGSVRPQVTKPDRPVAIQGSTGGTGVVSRARSEPVVDSVGRAPGELGPGDSEQRLGFELFEPDRLEPTWSSERTPATKPVGADGTTGLISEDNQFQAQTSSAPRAKLKCKNRGQIIIATYSPVAFRPCPAAS